MALSDLIEVSYIDNTGYPASTGNAECVGSAFWHYWGPAGQLIYIPNNSFPTLYPNLPPALGLSLSGTGSWQQGALHDWANLYKAALTGSPYIEAYRGIANVKYAYFSITSAGTMADVTSKAVNKDGSIQGADNTNNINLYWRYPGIPPETFSQYKSFTIALHRVNTYSGTNPNPDYNIFDLTISTKDLLGTTDIIIEKHTVSVDPGATLDGNNVFIDDILLRDSEYFRSKSNFTTLVGGTYQVFAPSDNDFTKTHTYSTLTGLSLLGTESLGLIGTDYTAAIDQFSRFELSRSTIILGTGLSTNDTGWLSKAAYKRNNVHIFNGINKGSIVGASLSDKTINTTDLTAIRNWFNFLYNTANGKWATNYAAKEIFDSWAGRLQLNCTGTIAGATISTALAVNRNQPASAQAYGSFPGTLYDALPFETLLAIHDESGIGGVYDSITGPQIFNVRTGFNRQTSYFGKLNCMRVIEAILDRVIRACLTVIHTPTAANPIQRAIFASTLTSILSGFMPNEILTDSYADVGEAINNDTATHGGEILYINLNLHLIKVVERVKISVIATDSSVTVQY